VKARAFEGATAPIHTADPCAAYLGNRAKLDAAIQSAFRQPHYVLPVVDRFKHKFAPFVGSAHGVGVNVLVRLVVVADDEVALLSPPTLSATVVALHRRRRGSSPRLSPTPLHTSEK
jgi:hypothetical protein